MGKKAAVPKTKAAAKAPVKKTAAKTKPGKFATKAAAVKAEKASPKPNKKSTKLELVEAAEEQASSSGTTLGYPRGTVSALLTSLKYQQKAVKNTQEQKDNAAKALEDFRPHISGRMQFGHQHFRDQPISLFLHYIICLYANIHMHMLTYVHIYIYIHF